MNEVKIFEKKEFGQVRSMLINDKPMFVATDIAKALGYKNPAEAITTNCKSGDIDTVYIAHSNGIGGTYVNMIGESNVYRLIMRSELPQAEQFQDWVCEEVLPSIRKNGGYLANQENLTPEQIVAKALVVAHSIIENQKKAIAEMAVKMNELKERTDYLDLILQSNKTVTVTQLAADYGMSAKAMNKLLEKLKVQHKVGGQWILYAKYLGEGYVHSKTVVITRRSGLKDTVMNTEWKQKGRLFLYNLLKENGILPLIER